MELSCEKADLAEKLPDGGGGDDVAAFCIPFVCCVVDPCVDVCQWCHAQAEQGELG